MKKYSPDYSMSYIEGLIQHLSIYRFWISPADALDALWRLEDAGIEGEDAETSLRTLLDRLAEASLGGTFLGWARFADNYGDLSTNELGRFFGMDTLRAASVLGRKRKS